MAGCAEVHNDEICIKPSPLRPITASTTTSADRREIATSCVHRWAYRLARSDDPAPHIADAVMGGCLDTLFPLTFAMYQEARTMKGVNPNVRLSMSTGLEVPVGREVYDEMRALALFHVVQARAGRCWYKARGE